MDKWKLFLDQIKNKVIDAIVIPNEQSPSGIIAQVCDPSQDYKIKHFKPTLKEAQEWYQIFEQINGEQSPKKSKILCTFCQNSKSESESFHIIDYNKNSIKAHYVDSGTHKSLIFSKTEQYIFVAYVDSTDPSRSLTSAFMAIDKLARFVRDCEMYGEMQSVNNETSVMFEYV